MASTRKIAVSNGAATAITVLRPCTRVMVGEDGAVAGYPTTDFLIQKPSTADAQIRFGTGAYYNFYADRGGFVTGQIIGYVQAVQASTTFLIDEGGSEIGAG